QKDNLNIDGTRRMGQLRTQIDHLTRLKRQPSKIEEEIKILQDKIFRKWPNQGKYYQRNSTIRIKADEAKSILESKKEELDEIKEKFDEKTEIINQIRAIE
ncbi:3616_t:CDS:2, partial [Funneliformis geosporum]